jgi:hypothetical protein
MPEFIPFILILISWHPDEPGVFALRRAPHVYPSLEQCELDGQNMVEGFTMYKYSFGDANFVYHCVPSASRSEIDRVLRSLKEESDSEQTAPE